MIFFLFFVCGHFFVILSFKRTNNLNVIVSVDRFSLFKVVNVNYTVLYPLSKKLMPWLCQLTVAFSDILEAFTGCAALSWLPIWLPSEMVDLCFIHCHKPKQEILFHASKQCQTAIWIVDSLLILLNCEQMRHLFGKDPFHAQFLALTSTLFPPHHLLLWIPRWIYEYFDKFFKKKF